MKIGLIGFGKTGRAVAATLLESNDVSLEWVVRRSHLLEHRSAAEFLGIKSDDSGVIYTNEEFSAEELCKAHPVDVIVDFSSESGIEYYGDAAANAKITIITAISQYPDSAKIKLDELSKKTVVMHSPNITLGINFLIISAKILQNIAPYTDIEIIEEHFKNKKEVSGTARIIAEQLELPETSIKTIRAGGIIGVHEILFGFPYQSVRLKHESISREAFGNGVLFAIENLRDKQLGLYSMDELLLPYFHLKKSQKEFEDANKKPWWQFW